MPLILSFLLRVVFVLVGLVFAASVLVVATVLFAAWGVGALWARLTGRSVSPFGMRMGPRQAFEEMMRRSAATRAASRTPRADAAAGVRTRLRDVTDVEPK